MQARQWWVRGRHTPRYRFGCRSPQFVVECSSLETMQRSLQVLRKGSLSGLQKTAGLHTGAAAARSKEWSLTLNTGAKMPAFGLGTWYKEGVGASVELALKTGYRLVDCAYVYLNEAEVGDTLQKCFKNGTAKREDIFITSKLWNGYHLESDVQEGCEISLRDLQLDHLDLYLIHWPIRVRKGAFTGKMTKEDQMGYDAEIMTGTWRAMESLVDKGLVKAIGMSNFSITKTEHVLKTARIPPAVMQTECHPYCQRTKLKDYCDSKGIIIQAHSPLGTPTRPPHYAKPNDPVIMEDPIVVDIAKKHNVHPALICISFALHCGIGVIPGTVIPEQIVENMNATEIKLDQVDMTRLRSIDRNLNFIDGHIFFTDGFGLEELWDTKEDEKFVVKK